MGILLLRIMGAQSRFFSRFGPTKARKANETATACPAGRFSFFILRIVLSENQRRFSNRYAERRSYRSKTAGVQHPRRRSYGERFRMNSPGAGAAPHLPAGILSPYSDGE
ncbi:MAG: hypothetical protein E5W55_25420, partial [Mesorhizobium sp.]